ncbi:MAG: glycosyltransferase [Chloroflexota bacterium]
MRISFAANPALGHLLPLLPLAIAARDAGHDVVVLGGRSLEPVLAVSGLAHVEAGPADLPAVFAAVPESAGLTGRHLAVTIWSKGFAGFVAPAMADALLDLARTWRPDILIHDDSEQGTWLAAESLGIPHIALQATAWRGVMRRLSVEPLGRIIERVGLPADPDLARWHRHGYLATRPASLRNPEDPMPAGARDLRPVPLDEVGFDVPAWLEAPRGARKRVAVTLGTVGPARAAGVAEIIAALAPLDAEIVATIGADLDPARLGPQPANVHVAAYLPMSRLLPACDLVVFHGGSGTMLAALGCGVPMLMLPIAADQPENAARCEAAGVARVLRAGERGPDAIHDSATAMLAEPSWAARAAEIWAEIEAMPAPAALLPWIEGLAAGAAS